MGTDFRTLLYLSELTPSFQGLSSQTLGKVRVKFPKQLPISPSHGKTREKEFVLDVD